MTDEVSLTLKKMQHQPRKYIIRSLVLIGLIIFIVLILLSILVFYQFLSIPFLNFMDLILLSMITSTLPYALFVSKQIVWIRKLEHDIPNFLKDLAESNASGLSIFDGIQMASKGNYGAFTSELKKVNAQLSWGISLDETLDMLVIRVPSGLLARAVILIKEASRSGGETSKVLRAAAKEAEHIEMAKRSRESSMAMYIAIVYISFFVFVMIIAVVNATLVPQFANNQVELAESENVKTETYVEGISNNQINVEVIFFGLYSIAIVQALGDGLICGQLLYGKVSLGFKHSFIMLIATFFCFKILMSF